MTVESDAGGRALVFSVESFERAIAEPQLVIALRQPDIGLVVVDLGDETWAAMGADAVAEHLSASDALIETRIDTILGWFRDTAIEAKPDFSNGLLALANRELAATVTFVPTGIQVPGIQPWPVGDLTYICTGDEAHIVERAQGNTGALCGESRADGAACPGTLEVL